MAIKTVVKNGNVEGALKTFKQTVAKSGILKAVRKRNEGFEKPGVRKREAKKEGMKNAKKREKRNK